MVGRGPLRHGRARPERSRCCAALALTLATLASTGWAAQDDVDVEILLEPLELTAATQPYADALLDAWSEGDGDRSAGYAYSVVELMRNEGRVASAVELLDLVEQRFPKNRWLPMILAVRGDMRRHLGAFDLAERDLIRAELLADSPHYTRRLALLYARSFGVQLRLDEGLLSAARERYRDFEPMVESLIEETLDPVQIEQRRETEQVARLRASELRRNAAMRAYNLDMALWLFSLGEEGMRAFMDDELVRSDPTATAEARSRRGSALLLLARDALAGLDGRSPADLLSEARLELAGALDTQLLNFEEALIARLGLVEVAWLAGDVEAERALLAELRDRSGVDPTPEQEARRLAYEARRLLSDEAPAEDLRRALGALERGFDRVERPWLEAPRPPEGLGFLHWDTQRLVVGLWIRLLLELEGPQRGAERALEVLTRVQAIGTLSRELGAAEIGFDQVREHVPSGTGVLVFLPSLDESHLLAFDGERTLHVPLPSRRRLQRLVEPVSRFVRTLPADRRSPASDELNALGASLLPPEVRELTDRCDSLVFVGASLLTDPCLEALPYGDSTVGERFATSYLPSLGSWVVLARRATVEQVDTQRLVLLAGTGLPAPYELELSEDEWARLRRLAGPEGIRSGAAARLDTPWRAGLLAILGHGAYDPQSSRPASIAMPGGFLDCEEFEDARLPPMVCLLTCGAARGTLPRGDDGTVHLGGAALVGGARTVLLARNEIETEATLALFEGLVGCLRQGHPPDEALRRARTGLRDLRAEWDDPFYTDSLTLFGLGRPPRQQGGRASEEK